MREIKFRGFSKKHRQWLTGNYILNRGAHFIAPVDEPADGKTWEDYEVDPDTVGQFTGLTDKNGREIYEGDVLRSIRGLFVIGWGEEHAGFEVLQPCHGKLLYLSNLYTDMAVTDDTTEYETEEYEWEWSVIGNIHDNPEMLKRR